MIQRLYTLATLILIVCLFNTIAHANQHIHAIIGRSLLFNPQVSNAPIIAITIQYLTPSEMAETDSDLPPFRRIIPIETVYMPFPIQNSTLCMNITRDDQERILIRSSSHPPQERRYSVALRSSHSVRPERQNIINLVQPEGTVWANEWSSSSESPSTSPSEESAIPDIFDSLTVALNDISANNQPIATQHSQEAPTQQEHHPNGLNRNGQTHNGLNQRH